MSTPCNADGSWGPWHLESKSGENGVWWYEQLRPAFSLYHGAYDFIFPRLIKAASITPAVVVKPLHKLNSRKAYYRSAVNRRMSYRCIALSHYAFLHTS